MKLVFPRQFFEVYSDIKFHENPSSGRWIVPSGETDMTKLSVALYNSAKAPKNFWLCLHCYSTLHHTVCTLHAVHIAACNNGHTHSLFRCFRHFYMCSPPTMNRGYIFRQFLSTIVAKFPGRCGVHPRDREIAWHHPKILIKTKIRVRSTCRIQQNMQFLRLKTYWRFYLTKLEYVYMGFMTLLLSSSF